MAGESAEPQQNELRQRRNAPPSVAPTPPPSQPQSPTVSPSSPTPPSLAAASPASAPPRSKLRVPEAYRSRLIVAFLAVLLAISVRLALGRRPPLAWLIRGFRYERVNDGDGGSFSLFVSPFPVWVLLVRFVQFMLRRPQPRPLRPRPTG